MPVVFSVHLSLRVKEYGWGIVGRKVSESWVCTVIERISSLEAMTLSPLAKARLSPTGIAPGLEGTHPLFMLPARGNRGGWLLEAVSCDLAPKEAICWLILWESQDAVRYNFMNVVFSPARDISYCLMGNCKWWPCLWSVMQGLFQ